jgi:hypothetical protein
VSRLRAAAGRRGGDEGQVTILAIGFTAVAIVLVLVVAAAAKVHLERSRLLALTDLVALDASDAVSQPSYFAAQGRGDGVPLTDARVRASVELYLRAHPDATRGLGDVVVLAADTPDGHSAHVRLGAVAHPGGAGGVLTAWSGGVHLEADAVARAS